MPHTCRAPRTRKAHRQPQTPCNRLPATFPTPATHHLLGHGDLHVGRKRSHKEAKLRVAERAVRARRCEQVIRRLGDHAPRCGRAPVLAREVSLEELWERRVRRRAAAAAAATPDHRRACGVCHGCPYSAHVFARGRRVETAVAHFAWRAQNRRHAGHATAASAVSIIGAEAGEVICVARLRQQCCHRIRRGALSTAGHTD
eukprot:364907-Chlamydomonas_euryale.AAC.4